MVEILSSHQKHGGHHLAGINKVITLVGRSCPERRGDVTQCMQSLTSEFHSQMVIMHGLINKVDNGQRET